MGRSEINYMLISNLVRNNEIKSVEVIYLVCEQLIDEDKINKFLRAVYDWNY